MTESLSRVWTAEHGQEVAVVIRRTFSMKDRLLYEAWACIVINDEECILWMPPRRPAHMSREKVLKDLLTEVDRDIGKEVAAMD
jgi:hypothetical protein